MHKRYRAVLFSHTTSSSKEINFSSFYVFLVCFMFFTVFASITAVSVHVVSEYLYSYRLDLLRQEKNQLNEELRELNSTISNIENRVSRLNEKDDELRILVNLDPLDPTIREVGIGGGEDIAANKSEFFFTEQELLSEITPKLEKIRLRVALQEESFIVIEDGIEENKEWLRYYPGARPIEDGRIRSPFGRRPDPFDESKTEMHKGLDIGGLPIGTPIYATADGVVVAVERRVSRSRSGLGLYVKLEHKPDKFKRVWWETKYGHLSKIENHIKVGTRVTKGDKIGELGRTGRVNGPHLHYEIVQVVPDKRNGFKKTAIDPQIAHINMNAYR